MALADTDLANAIAGVSLRAPRVPVVANVDACPHPDPADWPGLLRAQLTSPVLWHQSVARLADDGVATFVEVGPGDVLNGLVRRILPEVARVSVSTPEDVDRLALAGAAKSPPASPEGEHLHMAERLVVSPAAGVFSPSERWRENLAGSRVEVGEVLGTVGDEEIRSRFAGVVMGIIAHEGEQLLASQPVAWLRT
jgi:[acyl-carrier-protein] S-malonyltransferase